MEKLFMILIGCRPPGRFTEQHDIFFGIGTSIKDLIPELKKYWPEVKGNMHIDAWREVTQVDGYTVSIIKTGTEPVSAVKLFFINLGGYKENEFEEFHYKMLVAGASKGEAVSASKKTAFYKHTGFTGAPSHIDDKYGIDVDDIFEIHDILREETKKIFHLKIEPAKSGINEDLLHLGYFKLESFK